MDTASSLDDDMTLRDFCGLQDGVCAVDRRMGEAASRGGGPVGGATSAGGGGWVPGGGLPGSGPGRAGEAAPRPGGGGRAAGKAGSGGRGRKHSRQDAGMDVSAPAGRRRRYVPAQVTPSVPLPFPAYGQEGAYNYRNADGISNGFQHPFTVRYSDSWAHQVQSSNYAGALFTSLEGGNRRGTV